MPGIVTTAMDAVTSAMTAAMETSTASASSSNAESTTGGQDMSVADDLHFVMSAIVGPILCFLGMAGNLMSIIVWCRPGMRSSTGRYLTGQAVADFGVLLMFILCDSAKAWNPELMYSSSYGVFFSYIGYPLFFYTIVCSIWFTVGVTVDRYIMVCWITKAKKFCNEKRANFGLLLIAINSFIINLPHFASFTPVDPDDTGNSSSGAERQASFKETDFGSGDGGKFYEFWIHCIILILIPWVSVLFMNVMIINKINDSNKRMADKKTSQSMKKSKESENQITRLLLTVTFTFLFFIGIQCIVQCLWMQKPPGANWLLVSSSFAFAKTGIVFNSSLNFVLYCLTGRRFRLEMLKMLGLVRKDLQLSSLVDNPSSGSSRSGATTSTTGTSGSSGI